MSEVRKLPLLPTLSTVDWTYRDFFRPRGWRDQSGGSTVINQFILRNRTAFDFLGIKAEPFAKDGLPALRLYTSSYAGSVPLRSPMNGKNEADLNVVGRFGENSTDIVDLLEDELNPEFAPQLKLVGESRLRAPLFLECCKFMDLFAEARKLHWRKFENRKLFQKQPGSSTQWEDYALRTARDPNEAKRFLNKPNILSTDHTEWLRLNFVLQMCVDQLISIHTPVRTRMAYGNKCGNMRRYLTSAIKEPVQHFQIRHADPRIITRLKEIANRILDDRSNDQLAWRIDYNLFFERFVQYLFREASRKRGYHIHPNPHYSIHARHHAAWMLKYLEPDIVLTKDEQQIVVDAKYKSHMFNINADATDDLRDSFRSDLHQVIAYSSFSQSLNKTCILAYPANVLTVRSQTIQSPFFSGKAKVYLLGLPIERKTIEETVSSIAALM